MNYSMYMYDHSSFALKFVFLKFFQKSPGGIWTAVRRLIYFVWFFGFLLRNRLTVSNVPPSDTSLIHPVYRFFHELPGDDEYPPSDLRIVTQFCSFTGYGMILMGKKGYSNYWWMIRCQVSSYFMWLGVKLKGNCRNIGLGFKKLGVFKLIRIKVRIEVGYL